MKTIQTLLKLAALLEQQRLNKQAQQSKPVYYDSAIGKPISFFDVLASRVQPYYNNDYYDILNSVGGYANPDKSIKANTATKLVAPDMGRVAKSYYDELASRLQPYKSTKANTATKLVAPDRNQVANTMVKDIIFNRGVSPYYPRNLMPSSKAVNYPYYSEPLTAKEISMGKLMPSTTQQVPSRTASWLNWLFK